MAPIVPMVLMANGNINSLPPQLIIIINHRCNFQCRYCPTIRDFSKINYDIAIISVDFFLKIAPDNCLIKFSGGEPLMNFALLRDIIIFARKKAEILHKKIQFQLTTNGSLLNNKIIDFLKTNRDIELIISLDGDRDTQLRNRITKNKKESFDTIILNRHKLFSSYPGRVTINMVIAPNTAEVFYNNFIYVLKLGFNRFNFLPAYFIYWDKNKIKLLKNNFYKIARFILGNRNKMDIYIRNLDFTNTVPLFNAGLVVDCNGDIFTNNLFLAKYFAPFRKQLKIGSVRSLPFIKTHFPGLANIRQIIKEGVSKPIFDSTMAVDKVLTSFVRYLKNEKS
ncbi:MAG: radical SAM protein [Candidatus Omnitrophota bacterium]|nr:radical SAM protein [Candidatus Omnitrophota bacterium]